jgi:hypothetical protein
MKFWGNTNTWWEGDSTLPSSITVMPEYRLNDNPRKAKNIHIGFSEKNSANDTSAGFPRSGVTASGVNLVSGSWEASYTSAYVDAEVLESPALVHFSWAVECAVSLGKIGVTERNVYDIYPDPVNTAWNMFDWTFNTAQICITAYGLGGIVPGTPKQGSARNTILFEIYGGVNEAYNKLPRKWAGRPLTVRPASPYLIHATGSIYLLQTETGLFIVNTDNDESNPGYLLDPVLLPGGANEWMFPLLSDNPQGDGSYFDTPRIINPISGFTLVRRSYYEPLLAA